MDYQQPSFYRFSEDSIWLAQTVASDLTFRPGSILDVGCGCGVIGLELSNHLKELDRLVLLEKQPEFLPSLQNNLSLGKKDLTMQIVNKDIYLWDDPSLFDLVVSNPPYFRDGDGRKSPNLNTQICRTFMGSGLVEFVKALRKKVAPHGAVYILARTDNPDFDNLRDYKVVSERGNLVIISFQ